MLFTDLFFALRVNEDLYIAARKRRFRRIRNGDLTHFHSRLAPIVFDRIESLQQKMYAKQLPEPLDIILVTNDYYLSLALTEYFFKFQRTHVCANLEEAEAMLKQTPQPRVFIDLDGVSEPAIDVLNMIRQWQITWPHLKMIQLTACRCIEVARLIDAASIFPVVERRLRISDLLVLLTQKRARQDWSIAQDGSPSVPFSKREWNILLAVAKGESLKSIAASFNKPYHTVVYTLGRIAARIGVGNNKSLIHLLNKLSCASSGKV